MTVANLSHLLPFLESLGVHPKKSLSQNFLIDANIVRKIAMLADVQEGDRVLEIGPGPGALTSELLARGAFVTAIEKDTLFAKELERLQNGRLTVIEADILTFDWTLLGKGPWKVLGNLPYHITTPILEKVCEESVSSFTFMVQKELADRLLAKIGTRECSSLSIFIQSQAKIQGAFGVSRNCFYPSPKVDSSVISLEFQESKDPKEFYALVRSAFQQRRKMLSSTLGKLFGSELIKQALKEINILPTARPEELSLSEWRLFFKTIQKTTVSNEKTNCPAAPAWQQAAL